MKRTSTPRPDDVQHQLDRLQFSTPGRLILDYVKRLETALADRDREIARLREAVDDSEVTLAFRIYSLQTEVTRATTEEPRR